MSRIIAINTDLIGPVREIPGQVTSLGSSGNAFN